MLEALDLDVVYRWLTQPRFTIGDHAFSAANVLKLAIFLIVIAWSSRLLRRLLARRVLPRFHVDPGPAYAIANLTSYAFLTIGFMVGFQTAGVDLSSIAVLLGALGVGIGFGLQNIAANFVSGMVILFERPVQVGDRIQIGDLHAQVVRIRARATEVLTNDSIAVIVPNSEITSQRVVNWSRGGESIRVRIPIGVAYGSDVEEVRKALLEAAAAVEAVLKHPAPHVRLKAFGDSSIDFELLVWTSELLHRRGECISRVNYAIHDALERHGIHIPFPQRDVHIIRDTAN